MRVPGPGGNGLARRNHEALLIPWNGRAQPQNQILGSIPRRGDPGGRPGARRLLRKSSGAPGKRAHPADAFCAQCPYPRATIQVSWKCQTLRAPRQSKRLASRKAKVSDPVGVRFYFWIREGIIRTAFLFIPNKVLAAQFKKPL